MSFNAIRENKILAKISGFTVQHALSRAKMDSVKLTMFLFLQAIMYLQLAESSENVFFIGTYE